MSMTSLSATAPLPPLKVAMYPHYTKDIEGPKAKRGRYENWDRNTNSSGTSPSQSEELNGDGGSAENTAPHYESSFTELKNVKLGEGMTTRRRSSMKRDVKYARPEPAKDDDEPSLSPPEAELTQDSRFYSYQEFDDFFERWKRYYLHPFRVASSEALREPDGNINPLFKYRYVVYHCAHYGEPRMRGNGKRPNQSYLPCGCKAMLRLNYSFTEKCLKITTIHAEHSGHEVSEDMYNKVMQKIRRSIPPAFEYNRLNPKPEPKEDKSPSPLSTRNTAQPQPPSAAVAAPSPVQVTPAQAQAQNALLASQQQVQYQLLQQQLLQQQIMSQAATFPANTTANSPVTYQNSLINPQIAQFNAITAYLQQQQQVLTYLTQQKENVNVLSAVAPLSAPMLTVSAPEAVATADAMGFANTPVVAPVQIAQPADLPAPMPIRPIPIKPTVGMPLHSPPIVTSSADDVDEPAPTLEREIPVCVSVKKEAFEYPQSTVVESPKQISEIDSLLKECETLLHDSDVNVASQRKELFKALLLHWKAPTIGL